MYLEFRIKATWLLVPMLVVGLAIFAPGQSIQGVDTGFGGGNSITGTVLTPSGQRMERRIAVRVVSMEKGDRVTMTDDFGNFGFRGLPNGDYQIVIDKEKEYEPFSQNVNVFQMRGTPGQNFMLSVRLKPKAGSQSKPGVVNAELAGVPADALAFFKKASELANSGDRKGAIEQLELAIAAHPKFALAYNDMGVQYLKMNDLGRADDAFKTALNIDAACFPALLNHGIVLFDIKKYADAEKVFLDVVKAKEGSAVGHYFLGQSMAYLGKFQDAQKELTTALKLGGEAMAGALNEARRLLAIIYANQGDKKKAADELEAYLKLAPTAADAEQLRQLIRQYRGTNN